MIRWKALSLTALMAVSVMTGCGQLPGTGTPTRQGALDASATRPVRPIELAFNDTYLERVDLNMPQAKRNPYNTDKSLFKLLRSAEKTLDGAFYDIDDPGAVDELIKAHGRGVKIRLITDTDNLVDKTDPTKPRAAIERLKAAGIPVVDDQRSGIMHHKFLVVDGETVWTGSTNLTPTSLYCHNNNALTIHSIDAAKAYGDEFERLFVRREFGKSARGGVTLPSGRIETAIAEVQIFFSPAGGGREAVVAELSKAKKSIKFMTFSLTDPETGAMIMDKAKQGVKVEGIFDRWLAAGQYSLFKTFKAAGLGVLKDGNEALMHHKVILIDGETVITGSYNYSQNAENNNNEAFLIIRKAPRLVKAYAREFDRLQHAAKHNRPPAHKNPKDPENKTGEGP